VEVAFPACDPQVGRTYAFTQTQFKELQMNHALNQLRQWSAIAFAFSILLCSVINRVEAKAAMLPAQASQTQAQPGESSPAANPADVATMDTTIAALYDVISGPAGKKRDWNRFRSLFLPGARMIPTGKRQNGSFASTVIEPEGYITRSSKILEEQGFFEKEIARRTETFGNIAHVFSTYEARHKAEDKEPFMRGINSIQLMNDGKRWWVVTVFWEAERPDNQLPKKYLEGKN
jgi:hypothetical protein